MRVLFQLFLVLVVVGAFVTVPGLFSARQKAERHFAEASQRIEDTIAAGKRVLDLGGLSHLRQVPESILTIPNLTSLNISDTEISSLDKVGQLTGLERLNLRETLVRDL